MMTYQINPFDYENDAHYEAMIRINNAVDTLYPVSVAAQKRRDQKRPANRYRYRVMMQDASDAIVAIGEARHSIDTYHPNKFMLDLSIEPTRDNHDVREQLYAHLVEHLRQFNPIQLSGACDSSQQHIIKFYESHGYEMKVREYESRLDLHTFDPTPFQSYLDRVAEHGIEIVDLNQLEARYPEQWTRMVYDIAIEVDQDVPWHEPIQPEPYDDWLNRFIGHPERINDCYLIALDGDQPVGITMMFKSAATTETLFTGLTGVKRTHRRKGIAIALKVSSLNVAKTTFRNKAGKAPYLMTENEENNPMFKINARLGFVRQPDWLNWVKEL